MPEEEFDLTPPFSNTPKEHAEKFIAFIKRAAENMKAPLESPAPLFIVRKQDFEIFKRLNYMNPLIQDPYIENKTWSKVGEIYWYEHKDRVYGFGDLLPKDFDFTMYEALENKPQRIEDFNFSERKTR